MRFLFNPALLDFVVILALVNLAANLFHPFGFVGSGALSGVSQVTACGFVLALLYTAMRERPLRR